LYAKEQQQTQQPRLPTTDTIDDSDTTDTTADDDDSLSKNKMNLRAELWCRMICGKTMAVTGRGSLADSFDEWQIPADPSASTAAAAAQTVSWIRQQAVVLAKDRHLTTHANAVTTADEDLTKLLLYHYYQQPHNANASTTTTTAASKDRLVPTVAATLLAAKLPLATASVVLGQLIPNHMPLVALQPRERWEAALLLHQEFYFLACYHLPLLVTHLDRYLPGWYWPKLPTIASSTATTNIDTDTDQSDTDITAMARNLEQQGQLPPSWLLSHLAGECEGTLLPISLILQLWDDMLTVEKNDARFFLTLAVLEQAADQLLLLTRDELTTALQSALKLTDMTGEWLPEWWTRARALQSCTPESVVLKLQNAEDRAVQQALVLRQERVEAELKARLEQEAVAHRQAQERKADEARGRLTRARLVAFYRKHAPEKEDNIDKIVITFTGRFEELDAKLKMKYGEGFNPAIKPRPAKPVNVASHNKLLATMNQGFGKQKQQEDGGITGNDEPERKAGKLAVTVSANEVLPVLCWSKTGRSAERRRSVKDTGRLPLKFYLVDSRSESAAQDQGRFPTAVSLSPEAMLDPERIQQNEDMFESLRGAVHIVVMGEGFSALPDLYGQKLSPKLETLMREDESKTHICALFFVKKGFPFVSVLDGGFAAAHSWLVREGPSRNLRASAVLVDYNPEASLFGQMETLHNASATEKAQRKMQSLLESSLVTMTRSAQHLERYASDLETNEGMQGIRLKFFGGGKSTDPDGKGAPKYQDVPSSVAKEKTELRFKNPFAGMGKSGPTEVDKIELDSAGGNKKGDSSEEPPSDAVQPPPTETDSAATSSFRNPFARKQVEASQESDESRKHADQAPTSNAAGTASEPVETSPPGEEVPVVSLQSTSVQPGPNPFAMFRQNSGKRKDETPSVGATPTITEAKPVSNPFKGLGAALNNSMKSTTNSNNNNENPTTAASSTTAAAEPTKPNVVPNMLKRNPFARFGSGGGGGTIKDATEASKATASAENPKGGFAGLNSFRKNALARIRTNESLEGDDAGTEESISFDTPVDERSAESKAKPPKMERV
jgi:hypothetical protein